MTPQPMPTPGANHAVATFIVKGALRGVWTRESEWPTYAAADSFADIADPGAVPMVIRPRVPTDPDAVPIRASGSKAGG